MSCVLLLVVCVVVCMDLDECELCRLIRIGPSAGAGAGADLPLLLALFCIIVRVR